MGVVNFQKHPVDRLNHHTISYPNLSQSMGRQATESLPELRWIRWILAMPDAGAWRPKMLNQEKMVMSPTNEYSYPNPSNPRYKNHHWIKKSSKDDGSTHRDGRTFLNELFPFNPGVRCSARLEDARSFVWKPTLLTAFTKGLVLRRSHLPQKKYRPCSLCLKSADGPLFRTQDIEFFAASRHVLLVVHELLPVHVLLVVIHVFPGLPHGLPLMLRICGKKTLRINVGKPKRTNMINSDDPIYIWCISFEFMFVCENPFRWVRWFDRVRPVVAIYLPVLGRLNTPLVRLNPMKINCRMCIPGSLATSWFPSKQR